MPILTKADFENEVRKAQPKNQAKPARPGYRRTIHGEVPIFPVQRPWLNQRSKIKNDLMTRLLSPHSWKTVY